MAAAQPNNADAPNPLDPLVNGASPLAGFPDFPEPPLEGVFSWGPAPVVGTGVRPDGRLRAGAGYRRRQRPTDGTPDPASGGPIHVTGAAGGNVTLDIGNPSDDQDRQEQYEFAVNNDIFFLETTGSLAGQWCADTPAQCGIDTTTAAVPSPNPRYLHATRGSRSRSSPRRPTINTAAGQRSRHAAGLRLRSRSRPPPASATLSYQWESEAPGGSSFTAISGATSSSYTTPATTAAQSGTEYEVVVSEPRGGSVTSSAATLTVNTAGADDHDAAGQRRR